MIVSLVLAVAVATPPVQHLPTVTIRAPKGALTMQVAKTEDQREFGLMNVTKLPAHTGMIFVFDTDSPVEFWMKNTLIPLDMVFVGADGRVRTVAANVPATTPQTPDDRIPRRDGTAKYVLELPAGEAAKDGITSGALLADVTSLSVGAPR